MASKTQVLEEGQAFRDALAQLASDGAFSPAEREGFSRLHLFYSDRLSGFANRPRFGEESDYYDNPQFWAEQGAAAVPGCLPGDADSQQPVYDAANEGGDSLDAVTAPAARMTQGLRGALLLQPAARPIAPAAAVPTRATGGVFGLSMVRSMTSPAAIRLSTTKVQPPGPTPPPKKEASEPSWLLKLLTLFPAEAVTVYTVGQSLGVSHVIVAAITLLAMIVVRWIALKPAENPGPPKYGALLVAGVSFLLWVAATDSAVALEVGQALQVIEAQKASQAGTPAEPEAFVKAFKAWATFLIVIWLWVVPTRVDVTPPEQS